MDPQENEITKLPLHPDPELTNGIQQSSEIEEEQLGYALNVMGSLYYESPSEEGEESLTDDPPQTEPA